MDPSSTQRLPLWRWAPESAPARHMDEVAVEEPLEIRIGGHAVGVTMRTPGDDRELVAGFLLAEGVLRSAADLADIRPCSVEEGNVVDVVLAEGVPVDLARLSRHVVVSSSCGLCGAASLDAVRQRFAAVDAGPAIDPSLIQALPSRLRAAQPGFDRTGGVHGAAIFDADGTLVVAREDIGRHNAVDKAIGFALLAGLLPLRRHVLLVSGRASFEIVQKALAAAIPIVAAVSAPSSLAVDLAHESGQTLVGFLRPGQMNIYAHPDRVAVG
ncbi:MAG: formate dehydrogenase accessory sulfurtransferase FdhD [Phycisphaerales bacterium]|nr:formate dehydrogenase accessory sulfurtransferase FdhD [Phycisphaerales bacterium]